MCLYPTLIDNPKYKANKKNGGIIPRCKDERLKLVPIGCGNCEECRQKKAGEWCIRLEQEYRSRKDRCRFITLTFNEKSLKKYMDLAREELEGKNKIDTKKGKDVRNIACKIAIRRWLERIRKETGKSIRHWVITELGGGHSKRIHMHGFIWDEEGEAMKHWDNGYTFEGDYMSVKAITYTTKYMLKVNQREKAYVPKVMCSAGIGENWTKTVDAKRAKYIKGDKTKEVYTNLKGVERGLPIYYRNKIYSEEERENLWLEKLDRNERWIGGSLIKGKNFKNNEDFEEACLRKLQEVRREAAMRGNKEISEWEREGYKAKLWKLRKSEDINTKEEGVASGRAIRCKSSLRSGLSTSIPNADKSRQEQKEIEDKLDLAVEKIIKRKRREREERAKRYSRITAEPCFVGVAPLHPLTRTASEHSGWANSPN